MKTTKIYRAAAIGIAGLTGAVCFLSNGADNSGSRLSQRDETIIVTAGGNQIEVTPLSNDMFRIAAFPEGEGKELPASQSVVLVSGEAEANTVATPTEVIISTPSTTLKIDRKTGLVTFFDSEGNPLLAESQSINNSGEVKSVEFIDLAKGNFYGAGERGHSLRLNGDSLTMFNRQNYGYTGDDPRISQMGITVPYFVSDKGYGVLIDDYNAAQLNLLDTISYTSETPLPLSYIFINGDGSLEGTTDNYTRLTGRQPIPPFWTLGYITSKYGYRTQDETLGVIDTLKRRGYPVDGVVLDLYWYGQETDMGRLEWNKEQFPDHKKMLADLKAEGVNTVIISQPYINKIGAIDNYNYLSERGMLAKDSEGMTHDVTTWVGDAGMFDMSNPETREWLWNRYRDLTLDGVEGWWGDLGEPEVHPLTIRHANGQTASQYHNAYGNEWSRLIFEGFQKEFPDKRLVLLMRGGTAGLQRYGVFPWSTDVSRSWGGFEPQIKIMLNSGLSGLGYMGSDVGGFAVDPEHPTDAELYLRWLQMGAFTPMLRTHAQQKPEPYNYPTIEADAKRFIKMRYEWLPYNYTLAYENAAFGKPLARPLNFDGNEADAHLTNVEDEYLWGSEVLVAPVLKKGARSRKVTFPAGEWVSWNHPALKYKGGTTATVKAPLSELPLFVKAGAFIPQYTRPIENVTQYDPQSLTVKYFPSSEPSEYTLFDDDRKSPSSLADGAYQLTRFEGVSKSGKTEIRISSEGRGYEGMPASRMLDLEVVGIAKPKSVAATAGTPMPESVDAVGIPMPECASSKQIRQSGWTYNPATRTLLIRFPWDYAPTTLTVE